jgi:hypothetical protein
MLAAASKTHSYNYYVWGMFSHVASLSLSAKKEFFHIMKWSFNCLHRGKFPSVDWKHDPLTDPIDVRRAGKDLADGFVGVLWAIKGDLEYYAKDLLLPSFRRCICAFCPANADEDDGPNSLTEFRLDKADWYTNLYTNLNWVLPADHNPLFDILGVTILTISPDLMHCKNMGTDMYIYGSILFLLCYVLLPNAASANLKQIWKEMTTYCRDNNISTFAHVTLSMFTSPQAPFDSYPRLKGRATEVRNLGEALLDVWSRYMTHGDVQHEQIKLLLQRSIRMEVLLRDYKDCVRLPDDKRAEFMKCGFDYLVVYNALANHYMNEGSLLFNITIKSHYLCHCILRSEYLNPRLGWCYAGEDYMNLSKRIMSSCLRGNSHLDAVNKFAGKYRVALHMELAAESLRFL